MFLDAAIVFWASSPLWFANILAVPCGRDGMPIHAGWFGRNKTWQGFLGGALFAVILALMLGAALWASGSTGVKNVVLTLGRTGDEYVRHAVALAVGALGGDLAESWVKRRLGAAPGKPWLFWDQFDAVLGGFLTAWAVDRAWFESTFIPERWATVLGMCVVYFLVHRALSILGHRAGAKSHPH